MRFTLFNPFSRILTSTIKVWSGYDQCCLRRFSVLFGENLVGARTFLTLRGLTLTQEEFGSKHLYIICSAKHSGGIGTNSDEESKENSKVLANKSDTEEQTLSKEGTPPLRKTGVVLMLF